MSTPPPPRLAAVPHFAAAPPIAGAGPRLLRTALARGRLPMGALRLTILRAADDALRARGVPLRDRRTRLDRIGRFLADHADRRRPPSADEVRRWARELVRRGRVTEEEAAACVRAVAFLYARVLGRPREGAAPASASTGPAPTSPSSHRGPITGPHRREDGRRQ